jgi:hypothetical protein
MDDAIRIVVTSLPNMPSFLLSNQITPRPEFVAYIIEYLFQEENAKWELAQNDPLKEQAKAA